jgi:predicted nucleic acid-binding protein
MSYLIDTNVLSELTKSKSNQNVLAWFGDRVKSIDFAVADRWGRLLAEAKRPLPAIDSLIAATALHFDYTLVTRNIVDFYFPGLTLLNPWS